VTALEITIQVLTCSALVGLLGAVGLRLTYGEVKAALKRCRFTAILVVNFAAIPALAVVMAKAFALERDVAIAMILLAAAPFAPVVPVFARMARADLAAAAALTAVFPLTSALLTPLAARIALRVLARPDVVRFNVWTSLTMLMATITLPLAAGVIVRQRAPELGQRLLRPVEVISETIGAISLAFVTVTQFGSIAGLGWRPRAPRTPGRGVRHEQPQYCSGSARSHSKFPWERGSFLRRRQRAVAHRTRLAARSVVALFRRGLTKGDAVCNQTAARCPFHCARARPEANLTRGLPPAARPFATPAQGPQTFSKPFHAPACVRQGRWRTRYS